MSRTLVRDAAQTHKTTSRRGLLERLFALAFDGLVYAQIWEDPVVDMEALEIDGRTRLIAIASGGCNLMSYVTAGPARVLAVDLNPAHIALLKLKIAAARQLDEHEDFFALFGRPGERRNRATYARLRPHLDPASRSFWEARTIKGRRRYHMLAGNLYRHGLLGRCIGFGHAMVRLHGRRPGRLLEAESLAEQRRIFEETIAPVFDSPIVRMIAKTPVAYFGLGIPPAQFDALKDDAPGGEGLAGLVRARVERLACDFPIHENYYAWQAFGRRYDPHARSVPPYLDPARFAAVKRFAERIEPELSPLTDRLAREPAASLDGYVLLDAQDWMNKRQLAALWTEINRTSAPGARVIFRTAGEQSPLPAMLPKDLLAPWTYAAERSRELHARDRSAVYGGFHLYRRTQA
jgi:S-adenosylmethionine-diacylglycerol 3-amino-3-carboxypropyl transferase